MFKIKRIKDRNHRKFVASLSCCVCGISELSQAAHIKNGSGTARAGDDQIVPLCCNSPDRPGCHHKQHMIGSEEEFWSNYGGIDKALELAQDLYLHSGNEDTGKLLVWEWKR